jgi:hypothetical protein
MCENFICTECKLPVPEDDDYCTEYQQEWTEEVILCSKCFDKLYPDHLDLE